MTDDERTLHDALHAALDEILARLWLASVQAYFDPANQTREERKDAIRKRVRELLNDND